MNIKATTTSPKVIFNNNILLLEGESYPENSFDFYKPIFEWFSTEFPKLDFFELHLKLSYMNSSSIKCILDILNILDDETTYLSDKKRNEYKMNLEKKNSIPSVLCYVTNIFLMGCNLGVS